MDTSYRTWLLGTLFPSAQPERNEADDRELVERFVHDQDVSAFTLLVRRHGPMVLGVCTRVLRDVHDAEDAFQATFLVLARQAASIWQRECLGGWLHRVAVRVSHKLRLAETQRRHREQEAASVEMRAIASPDVTMLQEELRIVLDSALTELPQNYRTAVVLCYLEGKTHQQAAQEMGCPPGSVWWTLQEAMTELRRRLTRKGVALSAAVPASMLVPQPSQAVPVKLLEATVAGGVEFAVRHTVASVPHRVVVLAEGAMKTGIMCKLIGLAALVLLLGVATAWSLTDEKQRELPPKADLPKGDKPQGKEEPPRELAGHDAGAMWVSASPDGRTVATAGFEGKVRLWDLKTGKETRQFQTGGQLGQVLFTPDGNAIFASGFGVPPAEWDFDTLKLGPRYYIGTYQHSALAIAPDGKSGASGWDKTIEIFERSSGKVLSRFAAHTGQVGNLVYFPNGTMLASSGPGGKAFVWDHLNSKVLATVPGVAPWALAIGPGGYTMATASSPHDVLITEVLTSTPRRTLTGPQGTDLSVIALSPDGTLAAGGTQHGIIHLWDTVTGKHLRELKKHATIIESLTFSKDGKLLLSVARGEKSVLVWDIRTPARAAIAKPDRAALETAWQTLGKVDGGKAFAAMQILAAVPEQAIRMLSQKPSDGAPETEKLKRWIKELDDDRFALRRTAEAELSKHLDAALPLLRETLKNPPSLEARKAIERLLAQMEGPVASPHTRRMVRMIEVLEGNATPEAKAALRTIAAEGDTKAGQAAKEALGRLGK